MIGEQVRVHGQLRLGKNTSDNYLYALSGGEDSLIVRSKQKMDEKERTVTGKLKAADDMIFLDSDHP
ncbi:MAG: hypothetical protein ABEJ95_04535 [Candidatus Nanohalobium sp.]